MTMTITGGNCDLGFKTGPLLLRMSDRWGGNANVHFASMDLMTLSSVPRLLADLKRRLQRSTSGAALL
jgi:hypothetical protein